MALGESGLSSPHTGLFHGVWHSPTCAICSLFMLEVLIEVGLVIRVGLWLIIFLEPFDKSRCLDKGNVVISKFNL